MFLSWCLNRFGEALNQAGDHLSHLCILGSRFDIHVLGEKAQIPAEKNEIFQFVACRSRLVQVGCELEICAATGTFRDRPGNGERSTANMRS